MSRLELSFGRILVLNEILILILSNYDEILKKKIGAWYISKSLKFVRKNNTYNLTAILNSAKIIVSFIFNS